MQINKCSNCGAAMSCICRQRRSIGGKMGCSSCIGALNAADRKSGVVPPTTQKVAPPTVQKVTHINKKPAK